MKPKTKDKPKLKTPTDNKRVYSYVRFSTPEQSLGDSERRQLDMTKAFAEKERLPFDEKLQLKDDGLSGYHGYHRKKGVLGQFLRSVEEGDVPAGSILVVENIDRLSREGIATTLREIIFKLWDYDITLQTLSPEERYEPGCDNDPKFIALWLYINRAYDESKRKSERIRAARKNARKLAREERKILTSKCPAWLTVIKDDDRKPIKFKVKPEAQETIKMIFDLKLKGVGKQTIAKRLNKEAIWTPPKNKRSNGSGLRESYIQKILQNRAVIGEYQPHKIVNGKRKPVGEPIPNYYPRAIDDNTFYAVKEMFKKNKCKGGRTGKANNLFTHLVKCPYCGASMAYIDKGKPPKGASYLVCDNARRGNGCARYSIRYDECEKVILENCKGLRADVVLPNPDEQSWRCQSLSKRIQAHAAELQEIEERIKNYDDQIGRTKDPNRRDKYEVKVIELEQQKKDIEKQKEKDERELNIAKRSLQSFTKWKKDLASLQKAINENSNAELRMRLRSHLRELIEKIEVFAVGFKEIYDIDKDDGIHAGRIMKKAGKTIIIKEPRYFNNSESIEDYLYEVVGEADPKFARSKLFRDFVKDLTKRRMSKEGRFLRIHFKTGVWIDVVPEGSLASGNELIRIGGKSNWRFVSPDIDRLWNEYKAKTG